MISKYSVYPPSPKLAYGLLCWNNTVTHDFSNKIKFYKHCSNTTEFYLSCDVNSHDREVLVQIVLLSYKINDTCKAFL